MLRRIDSTKLNENDVAIPDDAKDPAAAIDSAKSKLTWFGIGILITFKSFKKDGRVVLGTVQSHSILA